MLRILQKIILSLSFLVVLFSQALVAAPLAITVTQPVAVHAQDGGGASALGFSACSAESYQGEGGGGTNVVFQCVQSVLRFVFVLGLFIGAFRFAVAALGNYAPGGNADAIADSRKALNGIVIGLLLMGAPGAILSLLNPAATNIDFLSGLSGLGSDSAVGGFQGAGDALGGGDSDENGNEGNGGSGSNDNSGNGSNSGTGNSSGGTPNDGRSPEGNYTIWGVDNIPDNAEGCRNLVVSARKPGQSTAIYQKEACPNERFDFATFNPENNQFELIDNIGTDAIYNLDGFSPI
jgi:hypothetical protein